MKQMYLYVYLISEGSKYVHPLYATEVYFFLLWYLSAHFVFIHLLLHMY